MRFIRGAVAGVIVLALTAVIPSQAGASAPSAPYDAFTFETTSPASSASAWVADPSTPGFTSTWTGNTLAMRSSPADIGVFGNLALNVSLPTAVSSPTVGTTFPTATNADATHAGLFLALNPHTCDSGSGTLTIDQFARDPGTQAITAFAASYTLNCSEPAGAISGDIRWHANVGYQGVRATASAAFGSQPTDAPGTPQTITVTGAGTLPETFGAATLVGTTPGAFSVTSNSCTGKTLAYGDTCSAVITPHPAMMGLQTAALAFANDTAGGQMVIPLEVTGANTRSLSVSTSSLDFGSQQVGTDSTVKNITFTGTNISPVTFGLILPPNGPFGLATNTCAGATLALGHSCVIGVVAHPSFVGTYSTVLVVSQNTVTPDTTIHLSVTGYDGRSISIGPGPLDFGSLDIGTASAVQTATVTDTGTASVTLGTVWVSPTDTYSITHDLCSGVVLSPGHSCTIGVQAKVSATGAIPGILNVPNSSLTNPAQLSLYVVGAVAARGTFYPLSPDRILDTRKGIGAPTSQVGALGVVKLKVAGRGGVPISGVSAVVMNVTVTGGTAGSFLTIYPDGVNRPTASSLNFGKGWTGANSVTVQVSASGMVDIFNSAGKVNIIADVVGFYARDVAPPPGYGIGGQFQQAEPQRLLDTRPSHVPVAANTAVYIPVDYGAVPDGAMTALIVNVTAVDPAASGYLTTWDGSGDVPDASTLNFTPGRVVPNLAVVPVAPCPSLCGDDAGLPAIAIYTTATTDLLVDVFGFYDDGTLDTGLRFQPITPTRITDTRIGLGVAKALAANATARVTPPTSVVPLGTMALALNVTAVTPTANTYMSVWPDGIADIGQPESSNLNPAKGVTVPNAVDTLVGPQEAFNIYNHAGTTNVLVDVVGTFYAYQAGADAVGANVGPNALAGTPKAPSFTDHVPLGTDVPFAPR